MTELAQDPSHSSVGGSGGSAESSLNKRLDEAKTNAMSAVTSATLPKKASSYLVTASSILNPTSGSSHFVPDVKEIEMQKSPMKAWS
jgi:hypothetical protein